MLNFDLFFFQKQTLFLGEKLIRYIINFLVVQDLQDLNRIGSVFKTEKKILQ